jgi:hypothetical protein
VPDGPVDHRAADHKPLLPPAARDARRRRTDPGKRASIVSAAALKNNNTDLRAQGTSVNDAVLTRHTDVFFIESNFFFDFFGLFFLHSNGDDALITVAAGRIADGIAAHARAEADTIDWEDFDFDE